MATKALMIDLLAGWKFITSEDGNFTVSHDSLTPITYGSDVLDDALSFINLPIGVDISAGNAMGFCAIDNHGMKFYLVVTTAIIPGSNRIGHSSSRNVGVSILTVAKGVTCNGQSFPLYSCEAGLNPFDVFFYAPLGAQVGSDKALQMSKKMLDAMKK